MTDLSPIISCANIIFDAIYRDDIRPVFEKLMPYLTEFRRRNPDKSDEYYDNNGNWRGN